MQEIILYIIHYTIDFLKIKLQEKNLFISIFLFLFVFIFIIIFFVLELFKCAYFAKLYQLEIIYISMNYMYNVYINIMVNAHKNTIQFYILLILFNYIS